MHKTFEIYFWPQIVKIVSLMWRESVAISRTSASLSANILSVVLGPNSITASFQWPMLTTTLWNRSLEIRRTFDPIDLASFHRDFRFQLINEQPMSMNSFADRLIAATRAHVEAESSNRFVRSLKCVSAIMCRRQLENDSRGIYKLRKKRKSRKK